MKSFPLIAVLLAFPAMALAANSPATTKKPPASVAAMPKSENWTYRKQGLNLGRYDKIIIDQTAIYKGHDAQFGEVSAQDQAKFAQFVTTQIQTEIAKKIQVVKSAAPGVLRLKLTLLGAETTKGGVATATRVTPFGIALNSLKSVQGKPGAMTGSLLFAVELFDAKSGELLVAAVRRKSPSAMDIPATFSTADTVKAVARDIGREIAEKLDQARHPGP